jgi:hypothetical protein
LVEFGHLGKMLWGYIWVAGRFLKRHKRYIREEDNKFNSFQANAPLTVHEKGVHFWGSMFPSKMGPFAPFSATIQALSRTRAFLPSENE